MENITRTVLNVGIKETVRILHVTDAHIAIANDKDTEEHKEMMRARSVDFHAAAGYPPHTPSEYLIEAIRICEEENMLLVNTGDTMDIYTYGNIEEFHRICDGHDIMFTPGGHEHQCRCIRTLEEPYPYWETVRPKLCAAFPEFDMDFSSRIINGINIICADNSLDYYSPVTLSRFKAELDKGLPAVVFSHDPLDDELLLKKEPYHPNVRLTPEDYRASHEMIELLKHHPLVVTTVAGHDHADGEFVIDGRTHYMTAGLFSGACRYIEIR